MADASIACEGKKLGAGKIIVRNFRFEIFRAPSYRGDFIHGSDLHQMARLVKNEFSKTNKHWKGYNITQEF